MNAQIYHEPVYDLLTLARSNWHIHTNISSCSYPEMRLPNILQYAEKSGFERIAVVDHYHQSWHGIDQDISKLKDQAAEYNSKCSSNIEVIVGAELSAYGIGKYSDPLETNKALDYRLYASNHYHLDFWEHPSDFSPRGYAEHTLAILKHLIVSGRADCIAHPFSGLFIAKLDDRTSITKAISDEELGSVLQLGKDYGVSWETNVQIIPTDVEFAKRYWNVGREVGVNFRIGTDAHSLLNIYSPKQIAGYLGEVLS